MGPDRDVLERLLRIARRQRDVIDLLGSVPLDTLNMRIGEIKADNDRILTIIVNSLGLRGYDFDNGETA